jgi:two-component system, LuxR family, response regulator FixJ
MLQPRLPSSEIFIADDEECVRDSLSSVFTLAGYRVTTFKDGAALVFTARVRMPVCILLDICMPGQSGLDTLKQLDAVNYPAPIFIISGRGDIPSVVQAIKSGACDFMEKGDNANSIVERVETTLGALPSRRPQDHTPEIRWRYFPGRNQLTRREIEVLAQITAASSNKEAARDLGISRRTIEVHRRHIMQKLGAKNAVDLVRIVLKMEGDAQQPAGFTAERGRNGGREIGAELQRG